MTDIKRIAELDRSSVLHPFTQLKDFATGKLGDPTIISGGRVSESKTRRDVVTLTDLLAFIA